MPRQFQLLRHFFQYGRLSSQWAGDASEYHVAMKFPQPSSMWRQVTSQGPTPRLWVYSAHGASAHFFLNINLLAFSVVDRVSHISRQPLCFPMSFSLNPNQAKSVWNPRSIFQSGWLISVKKNLPLVQPDLFGLGYDCGVESLFQNVFLTPQLTAFNRI